MPTLEIKWRTRDGREISVREMTDSHLTNTVNMLERNAPRAQFAEGLDAIAASSVLQGDMAQFYAEQDIARQAELTPEEWLCERAPVYVAMRREMAQRGLRPFDAPLEDPLRSLRWV